jgi:ribonucleoside-diphosphate reductase alpha chain
VEFNMSEQQTVDERLLTQGEPASAPQSNSAAKAKKEAGKRPAVPMTDKTDLASAGLVDGMMDAALVAGALAAAAAPIDKNDSKMVHPRRFTI